VRESDEDTSVSPSSPLPTSSLFFFFIGNTKRLPTSLTPRSVLSGVLRIALCEVTPSVSEGVMRIRGLSLLLLGNRHQHCSPFFRLLRCAWMGFSGQTLLLMAFFSLAHVEILEL